MHHNIRPLQKLWQKKLPVNPTERPCIYFHRDYQRFQGGHLKVAHYFRHILESGLYWPRIYFSPETKWENENPFSEFFSYRLPRWQPETSDALFLAGMDWQAISENKRACFPVPVINLIQGVRHADPGHRLYEFLSHRAVRICVSREVQAAIESSGRVNGPVFTIPNSMDTSNLPRAAPYPKRTQSLTIMGMKRPAYARDLSKRLTQQAIKHTLLTKNLPRAQFLEAMARSKTVVLLPREEEGFYLPVLEAMALDCTVICPDCVGNRSFCIDGQNAFRPAYNPGAILESIKRAMEIDKKKRQAMQQAARKTVKTHCLKTEKKAFMKILMNVRELYFKNNEYGGL